MKFINEKFKHRKYPAHLTSTPPLPFTHRDDYLSGSNRSKSNHHTTFITTFDSSISLKHILLEDWPRISSDSELRKYFQEPPQISYKHSPNLAQLLTRARLHYDIDTDITIHQPPVISTISYPSKNIKCRHEQCATCPQLTEKSYYSSYQTKHYYPIPQIFSCNDTPAIYLLECNICHKQYIGETHTTIRSRMKHHRNMSKTATNRPIYAHILKHQATFSIFSITIIDQVLNTAERKQKETYYINLLKTKVPFGLNVIKKS